MSLISQFFNHPQRAQQVIFTGSGTYSPPVDSWHWFTVVGGGGGGAVIKGDVQQAWYLATGGNGGSVRSGWVFLSSSQTYTITVGAGGASVDTVSLNTAVAGSVGSQSEISGGDLGATIIGRGGKGGKGAYVTSGDYSTTPYTLTNDANAAGSGAGTDSAGGLGGAFSLKINFTNFSTGSTLHVGTGGGAANIKNNSAGSIRGGDYTISADWADDSSNYAMCTGGGGVAGRGGDFSSDQTTPYTPRQAIATGGGGSGGNAADLDQDSSQTEFDDNGSAGGPGTGLTEYLDPGGAGGVGWRAAQEGIEGEPTQAEQDGGDGAGGGSNTDTGDADDNHSGSGGRFGGGAGMSNTTGLTSGWKRPGDGGVGGGGGGHSYATTSSTNYPSGAGGDGVVVLIGYFSPQA